MTRSQVKKAVRSILAQMHAGFFGEDEALDMIADLVVRVSR